jgi:hypothetical protein
LKSGAITYGKNGPMGLQRFLSRQKKDTGE